MVRLEPQKELLLRQGQYLGGELVNSGLRLRVQPEKKGAQAVMAKALTGTQKPVGTVPFKRGSTQGKSPGWGAGLAWPGRQDSQ